MQGGEGERLHAERRRRFWTILGGLALLGLVTGFVGAYIIEHQQSGGGNLPPMLATAAIALAVLAVAYGSWRFFASVDELELADNLWGSLVAIYTYAILFPAWWALAAIGQASEPDDWVIYGVTLAAGGAAYLFRKWSNR